MHFHLVVAEICLCKISVNRNMLKSKVCKKVSVLSDCKVHHLCDWK